MSKLSELRAGVIGCGGMGSLHARLIAGLAGARISAVADIDGARASSLGREFEADVLAGGFAVVAAESVDAVVVASPNETHPALVLAAVAAGKPVLCEKPLALALADAEAIVSAEVRAGRRLVQVGFMRRYDPRHQAVHEVVTRGDIGAPALVRGWHHSVAGDFVMPPEHALRSAMVHDFDSIPWLAGSAPVGVRAIATLAGGRGGGGWVADFLLVQITFASGALGLVEFHARSAAGYAVGVEVTASEGNVTTGPSQAAILRTPAGMSQASDPDWFVRFEDAYRLQAAAFARGAAAGSVTGPSAWDGMVALVVAEAAFESLTTGQSVEIVLPGRPALYD